MRESRLRSRQGRTVAALATAALALLAGPAAAEAAGGSIAGTVTAKNGGSPISGVGVYAFQSNDATPDYGGATTNSAGEYEIKELEPGDYSVAFSPPFSSNFLSQTYNERSDGHFDPVTVESALVSGIDAKLLTGGVIEGSVLDAASGTPIPGAEVCVSILDCDTTGAGGGYAIEGLETGEYAVEFRAPGYLVQFWSGKANEAEADPVAVEAEKIKSEIDAALAKPVTEEEPPPTESEPPSLFPTASLPTSTAPPRRKRCKRGYRRKKVHGHYRCVKRHRKRRARG